jgi:hypothetical protein
MTPYQIKRFIWFSVFIGGVVCTAYGVYLLALDVKDWFSGFDPATKKILMIIGALVVVWTGIIALDKVRESSQRDGVSGQAVSGGVRFLTGLAVFGSLVAVGAIIFIFANKMARDDMRDRPEKYAGYGPSNSKPAVKSVSVKANWYGDVDPRKGWQRTTLKVESGEKVLLQEASGEVVWAPDRSPVSYTGEYYRADELTHGNIFPLPSAHCAALIWRVNNDVFFLQQGDSIVIDKAGVLEVRINDNNGGLSDNRGNFKVLVAVKE